jgi:8-oxo-dGTP diphosphatase
MIDKLAWIEIQDKSMLLAKSFGKDKFYIPGGKRETGETDAEALVREVSEELSVTLDPASMQFIGVFEAQAHAHARGVMVRMTCYAANYSGTIQASSEIEAIRWFKYEERRELVGVDKLIFDHLREHDLI